MYFLTHLRHKQTLVARTSVETPRRSGGVIRRGSVRSGCGLGRHEPRFLGDGSGPTGPNRCCHRHELSLPPPRRRHPRALHVRDAIETPTLAARPAPPVTAILFRLVSTVLARARAASTPTPLTLVHVRVRMLLLLRRRLVELLP